MPRDDPAVAFNGSIHLAVFKGEGSIRARRFDPTLQLLDSSDIVLGDSGFDGPRVIADGSDFIVTWMNAGGSHFARISAAGNVLAQTTLTANARLPVRGANGILLLGSEAVLVDGNGQPISGPITLPDDCAAKSAAYASGIYLVGCFRFLGVASDEAGFIRFDDQGNLLDPTYELITNDASDPVVQANGSEFLIVVQKTSGPCIGRRIALDGTFASPTFGFQECPDSITTLDGNYHFAIKGVPAVRRYSSTLTALEAAPTPLTMMPGYDLVGTAAGNRATFLSVGNGTPGVGQGTVRAAQVDTTGAVVAQDVVISSGVTSVANSQSMPASATNAAGITAVVWVDKREPTVPAVYASRLDTHGNLLGGAAIKVADGESPQIASNGTDFLVTYSYGNYVHAARRLGADGTVGSAFQLPNPPVAVAYPRAPIALASDGTSYAYVQRYASDTLIDADTTCIIVRLNPDGSAVASPQNVDAAAISCQDLAYDGSNYLVLYNSFDNTLYSKRMSPGGTLDPVPTLISDSEPVARAAFGNGQRVVAYSAGAPDGDISIVRLDAENTVLDINPISIGNGMLEDIAPYGGGFLVARSSGSLLAHEVDLAGAVAASFELSPVAATPAVFASDGRYVFYQRFDPTDGFHTHRVRARRIGGEDLGESCDEPGDCQSGFCVGEVCCDTPCEAGICDTGSCVSGEGGAGQGGAEQGGAGGDEQAVGGSVQGGAGSGTGGGLGGSAVEDGSGAVSDGCGSCSSAPSGTEKPFVALAILGLTGIRRRTRGRQR
ncbi:MAG: hypothetical protein HOW73_03530 [Polyangiaceae bacterium]|nr:hypothetical protein [Polyangiaceae bacterium]